MEWAILGLLALNLIVSITAVILANRTKIIKLPGNSSDTPHSGIMIQTPEGIFKKEVSKATGGIVDNSDEGLWQREDGQQS